MGCWQRRDVKPLRSSIEYVRHSVEPGPHLSEMSYMPIDCLPRHSLAINERRPFTEAQSSLLTFREGDILFGAMRSYFHKVVIAPFDGVTRSTCFVLRPKQEYSYSWAVLTLFDDN